MSHLNAHVYEATVGRLNSEIAIRVARGFLVCLIFGAVVTLGYRLAAPVTLEFPDFPMGVAMIDLGQTLTIQVDAQNDGGQGVAWTCEGDACTQLTSTTKWATFYASGITGTATITATSIKRPSVHQSLKVTVNLNSVPDMLCDGSFLRRDQRISVESVAPNLVATS
jgi:hypothetical protein